MHTFLVIAVAVEAVAVLAFLGAWLYARRARQVANACDFPGCEEARRELERLADEHERIPRQDVLDVVSNVRAVERGDVK